MTSQKMFEEYTGFYRGRGKGIVRAFWYGFRENKQLV